MGFSILLLLRQTSLNLLKIQKFGAEFESERQLLFKLSPISLNLRGMLVLQLSERLCVFLLSLEKVVIPLLVKLLILLNMRLFAFFPLLSLVENKFFLLSGVVLKLQLSNPILRHFCLDVLAILFAGVPVLLKNLDKVLNIVFIGFLVQS